MPWIEDMIINPPPITEIRGESTDADVAESDPEIEGESVLVKALREAANAIEAEERGKTPDEIKRIRDERLNNANLNILEERLYNTVSGFCHTCVSLMDCPLPAKGWRPVPPDAETREMYCNLPANYAPWAYEKCENLLVYEQNQRYSKTVASRWNERNLSTFQVTDDNEIAYEICKAYAVQLKPSTSHGLYIHGAVGTGKTHLGVGIIKAAFNRNLQGAVVNMSDLLKAVKNSFSDHTSVVTDEVYAKKRFIVLLDDMGVEHDSEWAREEIYDIINARYEAKLPTIITTNLTPSEITARIGVRSADRIREMCSVVEVGGKSWRGLESNNLAKQTEKRR
jgi:DNA replication protein DnaC